jgi:Putative MetA-pathway of phenol degradation
LNKRITAAVSILAAAFCAQAKAADTIDTDGPDFVESSESVGAGRFQFESDVVSERDRRRGIDRISTPTLLRGGVTESIEVRVETEGRIRTHDDARPGGSWSTGDTAVGLKWHSQDRDPSTGRPSVSWILHFDTPSGTEDVRGHGIRPSLRSVITWELAADWSLGLMPGIKRDSTEDGQRYNAASLGAVLGRRLSERLRVFVESATPQIAHASDGGVLWSWDVGAAWLITRDWQAGIRAAVAANRNSPSSTLLLELAARF